MRGKSSSSSSTFAAAPWNHFKELFQGISVNIRDRSQRERLEEGRMLEDGSDGRLG